MNEGHRIEGPAELRLHFADSTVVSIGVSVATLVPPVSDEHGDMVSPMRLDYDPIDERDTSLAWFNPLALMAITVEPIE